MRWLAGSLLLAALTGCGGLGGVRLPAEVRIPVPVPCIDTLDPAPELASDEALVALDDYRLVLTLAKERKQLEAAYGTLRAKAEACVR